MFMPDLLRHLETLSRNLLALGRKGIVNRVELEALRRAEEFFRANADSFGRQGG